jgi:predicted AlkP superfamily phosphohydrolase/phosphomutase
LIGGAACGGFLLALERSSTLHVFADLMNATFRILGRYLSEATIVRLDTDAVTATAYIGGHALLGWLCALLFIGYARNAALRATLFAFAFAAADLALFGNLWRHRLLPIGAGAGLVTVGALLGALGSSLAGVLAARVPRRALERLAWALPVLALAAASATFLLAAKRPASPVAERVVDPARVPTGQKVALLGVDGLDWEIVEKGVAEGRLPRLRELIARGARGRLRSIRPPKSPVVWTSIATGQLPEVHGIRDFVIRRERRKIPVTANLRRSPALWNIANEAKFKVAILNWYVTWPVEPVPGILVSDRVDFTGLDRRVYPEPFTAVIDSVRDRIDEHPWRDSSRFTRVDAPSSQSSGERWGQVRRSLRILDEVVRHDLVTLESARAALALGQPDLTALYFRGNDNTQHLFWKYRLAESTDARVASFLYDKLSPADVSELGAVIDRYYDFMDELVGETIDLLEPDTAVFILSDHGFLTNNERGRFYHPNRLLEAAGLAVLVPGAGGMADSASSIVYEPGVPSVDARRVLRPGGRAGDPEAALESAWDLLGELSTEKDEAVFSSVEFGSDEKGPYLSATFTPRLEGDSILAKNFSLLLEEVRTSEGHSGDHSMNGVLLAVGPPFRERATIGGASAPDVAPTVLHLLGAPVGADMEGVVLEELFRPDWLDAHPIREVKTYGLREVDDEAIATEVDDRIREELTALGYIQ